MENSSLRIITDNYVMEPARNTSVYTSQQQECTQATPSCSGYLFISRLMSCVLTLAYSWPGENVSGQTKRAVAVAMQITIGDIGAIAG